MSHKGEPGPYSASTELKLLGHLIAVLEQEECTGSRYQMEDGRNHHISVDARIRSISEEEFTNIALMQEIQDGIRVLCVILTTFKKDRLPTTQQRCK